jgi:hypothetical protein
MGYIVGAKMAELCGSWQWGLRATPVMGIVAVVLILLLLQDPPRGESEGHQHLKAQTYGVSIGTILADPLSSMFSFVSEFGRHLENMCFRSAPGDGIGSGFTE